ncbi:MAG: hypothetical protein IKL55_05730 [Clostridia bacterium]|nr:hypothetical protein [Clostridia bacterium]
MKKKLFIFIAIIIVSFSCGIGVNYFLSKKTQTENTSLTIIGTIVHIKDNIATINPQDEEVKKAYPEIKFALPEGEESSWVVGDIVKAKYLPGHISEVGFIELTALESNGKARLFPPTNDVPVSNSNSRGTKNVFKSFFAYNEIELESFSSNNELYYKKITSYEEYNKYKSLIPELRTLTENDFINYYLIIVLSKDIEHIYMFNDLIENENSLNLELLKNKILSENTQTPIFSGVAIILPNITEVPTENIKLTIKK